MSRVVIASAAGQTGTLIGWRTLELVRQAELVCVEPGMLGDWWTAHASRVVPIPPLAPPRRLVRPGLVVRLFRSDPVTLPAARWEADSLRRKGIPVEVVPGPAAITPTGGPLEGQTVVVTRPEDTTLGARLVGLGAEVLHLPATRIVPLRRSAAGLGLETATALVFSSATAVRFFFEGLAGDARSLASRKIFAIGPGTAARLAQHGIRADFTSPRATTRELARLVARRVGPGDTVLYPCARERSREVARLIRKSGAKVREAVLYGTRPSRPPGLERVREATVLTFASARTAACFLSVLTGPLRRHVRDGVRIVCIGPVTAAEVRRRGFRPARVARRHDFTGLIRAVQEALK